MFGRTKWHQLPWTDKDRTAKCACAQKTAVFFLTGNLLKCWAGVFLLQLVCNRYSCSNMWLRVPIRSNTWNMSTYIYSQYSQYSVLLPLVSLSLALSIYLAVWDQGRSSPPVLSLVQHQLKGRERVIHSQGYSCGSESLEKHVIL